MEDPGRELKRFLEMASKPKMAALERAVGVDGAEFLPVRNSNNPNWWTINNMSKSKMIQRRLLNSLLVSTIRDGTLVVCTISSSPGSDGSLEDTLYRQTPPARGCNRMTPNGGAPMPKGILSADPKASMCTTILVCRTSHEASFQPSVGTHLFRFLKKSRPLVNIVIRASNGDPATLRLDFHFFCAKDNRLAGPRPICSLDLPKILQEPLLVQLGLHRIQVDGCRRLNHSQGSESATRPPLVLVQGGVLQVQVDVYFQVKRRT